MAKPNNIQMRFGVTVEVNRDIPKAEYVNLQNNLRATLNNAGLNPNDVRIYIHHIRIHASELHFAEGPLERRMEKLIVRLAVEGKAKRDSRIKFLNHKINFAYQTEIPVNCRDFRLDYTLPGTYCQQHREFDDYVAVMVDPNCPQDLRTLAMQCTAQATPTYWKKHLFNSTTGAAVTGIKFPLSQDIQLTF